MVDMALFKALGLEVDLRPDQSYTDLGTKDIIQAYAETQRAHNLKVPLADRVLWFLRPDRIPQGGVTWSYDGDREVYTAVSSGLSAPAIVFAGGHEQTHAVDILGYLPRLVEHMAQHGATDASKILDFARNGERERAADMGGIFALRRVYQGEEFKKAKAEVARTVGLLI